MKSVQEILQANKNYESKENELELMRKELSKIYNDLNLQEVKDNLTYEETKSLCKILKYHCDDDIIEQLEKIKNDKRIKEHPEVLGVKYYPILKQINFLSEEQKVKLDKQLKDGLEWTKYQRKLSELGNKIIDFLINNKIIQKEYVFHCTCGSDECYDKIITEDEFTELKEYWRKELEGEEISGEEHERMSYGCFETGCWNDGDVEVCSLDDWNKHLRRIDYRVIQEPDMTIDNI